MSFEITMQGRGAGELVLTLQVEASNWMDALTQGLTELGEPPLSPDAVCALQPEGVVRVTLKGSDRVYVVRERSKPGAGPRTPARPPRRRSAEPQTVPVMPAQDEPPSSAPIVRTGARPVRSEQTRLATAEALLQAATALDGPQLTAEAAMDRALDLARQHVPCATLQLLLPLAGTLEQLRVVGARGHLSSELTGARLALARPVVVALAAPQAATRLSRTGWRWRYVRPTGEHFEIEVIDLLWAPVRHRGRILSALALLNSQHADGFIEAEATALDVVANGLAKALSRHL